ncbi:MAG TPA: hypothetical protein VGP82_02290, partial [Ktedonobacterales bacterium]|nr:hypothetical protein [Ktedonobacterales bacterium]
MAHDDGGRLLNSRGAQGRAALADGRTCVAKDVAVAMTVGSMAMDENTTTAIMQAAMTRRWVGLVIVA